MTSNGIESKYYKTSDGFSFNSYIDAYVHLIKESTKTSAGCQIEVIKNVI